MSWKCVFTQRTEQCVRSIIPFQCRADQPAICTLYLRFEFARAARSCAFILPGAVCKFISYFSFPCFAELVSPLFFPSLLLSEVTFKSLGLFFPETACSSLLLLLPCSSLLLSLSDFHVFPSAVTISSFLTWKRRIAKRPVWWVSRKRGEKQRAAATGWSRLCEHFRSSRMGAGWRGSWVWYKPRRERCKQEEPKTDL